jgi:hypothetical protein
MNVIVVGREEENENPFFKEIISFSTNRFKYCPWDKLFPNKNEPIIFHWPELIFEWHEPTIQQLKELELKICKWKEHTEIMYVVHNERRHFGMTVNFKRLYQIVENASNTFIHMGNYSKDIYTKKYPNKRHVQINHPLYSNSFDRINKKRARQVLGIPQDRFILIAPGRIRNPKERDLIFKAFNHLKIKNKSLMVPFMLKKSSSTEFRGRHFLKRFFDIKKIQEDRVNNLKPPVFYFDFQFSKPDYFAIQLSCADAILIPRLDVLNSGNLFLGLTYRKPIVGPGVGNVSEILDYFNLPKFDPNNLRSLKKAMNHLAEIRNDKIYNEEKLLPFSPFEIAKKWDKLLEEMKFQ